MGRLTFVSGNTSKYEELLSVIPTLELAKLDAPEVQAIDSRDVISAKLTWAHNMLPGVDLVVEDTALHLDAMNGFPGALIKWMSASMGLTGIYKMCRAMGDCGARAKTVIGYQQADSTVPRFFEAEMTGSICAPQGDGGFGWDTIFIPMGATKSLASMSSAERNNVKMRSHAALKLKAFLKDLEGMMP